MEPFSALLALCAENSSVTGEFPAQRPVTFNIFFDLRLNKRVNNRDACDLRRHRALYDFTAMIQKTTHHYLQHNINDPVHQHDSAGREI